MTILRCSLPIHCCSALLLEGVGVFVLRSALDPRPRKAGGCVPATEGGLRRKLHRFSSLVKEGE